MIKTIRRCLTFLAPAMKRRWVLLVPLAVIAAGLEISGAAIVFGLINLINNSSGGLGIPLIGPYLTPILDAHGDRAIIVLGMAAAVYFIAKNMFLLFEIYYREYCATESAAIAATRLMAAYLAAPYSFHFGRNSSLSIRDLESSADVLFRTVLLSAATVLSEFMVVLGVASLLVVMEPVITLSSALLIGGVGVVTVGSMRKLMRDLGARAVSSSGAIIQSIQQALGSIKETKILGREAFFLNKFKANRELRAQITRLYAVTAAAPRLAIESIMVVGVVVIIMILSSRDTLNSSALPLIGLFAYTGFRIIPSANRIVMHLNGIRFAKAAVDGVYESMQAALTNSSVGLPTETDASCAIPFDKEVRLDNVTYRYPHAPSDALISVSLVIPKGSSIGIVGATGAGKTTLVDVLLGLLRPDRGRLLVDGHDVTDDPRPWQRKIGYVPQTIYLSDDSIAANIAFGIPSPDIDPGLLRRAAEMAQILDFIASLPKGFDTLVGESGIRLSGGQRQRIGIARALYHDPSLLVFDEATSALDNETEAGLSRAIVRLSGLKTVVLIAHRFSTLHSCKTLVMMKDGRIVAQGDHDTLLLQNDDFRKLANATGRRQPITDNAVSA